MASVEACEQAFHELAARLAKADDGTKKKADFDRMISCTLNDLGVSFAGRLQDGELQDIRRTDEPDGQVKLSMSSDDLLKLTSGELNFASAWMSGAVKVDANIFDLLKLRSVF